MPMHSKPHERRRGALPLIVAALASALMAQPVPAQDEAAKRTNDAAKTKPSVLTRDELRACMNEQDRLRGMRTRIEQDGADLERQKATVLAMDEELKTKDGALAPTHAAGRKAVKEEAARLEVAMKDYNARVEAVREQVRAYDKGREAWSAKCADRNYDEKDAAAIRDERAQAAGEAKK